MLFAPRSRSGAGRVETTNGKYTSLTSIAFDTWWFRYEAEQRRPYSTTDVHLLLLLFRRRLLPLRGLAVRRHINHANLTFACVEQLIP